MSFSGTGSRTASGVGWSFLSAFLWATVYVAVRWLMDGEKPKIDPVSLSLIRFALGGAVLFLICLMKYPEKLFALPRKDYFRIALLSQFSFVGMSVFLFWGQRYTTAVNSSMIMSCAPVMILLLGVFFCEKIRWFQGLGMLISVFGCMMVIEVVTPRGLKFSAFGIGDLLVFFAALSWSIAAIRAKRIVTTENDLIVTAWSMLFASCTLLLLLCCMGNARTLPSGGKVWGLVFYLALFPTALGFYAWNAALGRISIHVVNIMQYLTPILTVLMASVILGERLTPFQGIGIFFILGGMAVSGKKQGRKVQERELLS